MKKYARIFVKRRYLRQQAFTLVELLMVLLVISAFLFAGRTIYQRYVLRKEIAVVEQDVQLLFDQLDDSYYQLTDDEKQICSSKIDTSVVSDWSQILHSSIISDIGSGTSAHPDFRLSCTNPASDQPAQLIIEAPLTIGSTDTDKLEWYARRLRGELDASDNTLVKWVKIPTYVFAGKDPVWILDPRLEQFKKITNLPSATFIVNASVPSIGTSNPVQVSVYYSYNGGSTSRVDINTKGNASPQQNIKILYCTPLSRPFLVNL